MKSKFDLTIKRRDFLKLGLASSAIALVSGTGELFAAEEKTANIWVLHGKNKSALMKKALEIIKENGGFGKNVKKMALKVNAAWARTPEEGANTHPELVDAFLKAMKADSIEVVVPEHTCDNAQDAFMKSGVYKVVNDNGFKMIDLGSAKSGFVKTKLEKAKSMKEADIWGDFLNSDAVVNMPVAKSHGAATMTCALKNWMGAVQDRRFWHRNNLHQCIADAGTAIKPVWTIVDATRVMLTRGPKGPGDLNVADQLIISQDQLAIDSYVAREFFKDSESKIAYLDLAASMGIGVRNVDAMKITKIEV